MITHSLRATVATIATYFFLNSAVYDEYNTQRRFRIHSMEKLARGVAVAVFCAVVAASTADPVEFSVEPCYLTKPISEHVLETYSCDITYFLATTHVPTPPDDIKPSLAMCLLTQHSQRHCLLDYVNALGLIDDAFHEQMVRAVDTSNLLTPYGQQQHENLTYDDIMERYHYYQAFSVHEVNASSLVNLTRMIETCGRYRLKSYVTYTNALVFDGYISTANATVWDAAEWSVRHDCGPSCNYTLADVLRSVNAWRHLDAFIQSVTEADYSAKRIFTLCLSGLSACADLASGIAVAIISYLVDSVAQVFHYASPD